MSAVSVCEPAALHTPTSGQVADPRRRLAAWLSRNPVTAVLVFALLICDLWMQFVVSNPAALELWASTNIVNLRHHPITSLVASAFVSDGSLPVNITVVAVAFAVLERRIGARTMLAVVSTGHVVASLVTEAAVRFAILSGGDSRASARQLDVGVSYLMYTGVGAALLYIPLRWRRYAVAAVTAYLLVAFARSPDMTAWGHLLSLSIGVFSWPLLHRQRRTPARRARRAHALAALGATAAVALLAPR